MNELTLDEAIKHCLEVAEQNETQAEKWQKEGGEQWGKTTACRECAADYRQLVEWLTDYKELKNSVGAVKLSNMKEALELIRAYKTENATLREENKVLMQECDRLIKEKGELLSKVSGGDILRICQLEEQFEKAKRLLEMAVEDISKMPCNNDTHSPDSCYICVKHGNCSYTDSFKWCKADIALKLIGETNDEP